MNYYKTTTNEQIMILLFCYGKIPNKELAQKLGMKWATIRMLAHRFGLKKEYWKFTKEEDEFILNNYNSSSMEAKDIAQYINRTRYSVVNRYRELTGLRKKRLALQL